MDLQTLVGTLLASLATTAVAVGVIAYLGKSLVGQFLARDLENYRTQLQARAELELVQVRNQLAMSAVEHREKFIRLHERRAAVIAEVYGHLDGLSRFFRRWTNPFAKVPDAEVAQAEALNLIHALENYFYPNAIWLERTTCEALSALIGEYHELWRHFSRDVAGRPWRDVKDRWLSLVTQLRRQLAAQQGALEDQFRTLLGMPSAKEPGTHLGN